MASEPLTNLLCDEPSLVLHPFGIRCEIHSDRRFLGIVQETFRGMLGDPDPAAPSVRFEVAAGAVGAASRYHVVTIDGERIAIFGTAIEGHADAVTRQVSCVVDPAATAAPARLREELIEPLLLFVLTRNGRVPLHAAGFLLDDLAVLLCGPSGYGKSCLALAASRAGLPLLSDDIVHVQHDPLLQFWGAARPIHLFPSDTPPSTAGGRRLRNGKLKEVVSIHDSANATIASHGVLCLLRRGVSVKFEILTSSQAREEAHAHHAEAGFDLLRDDIDAALERLTTNGALGLTLSPDPNDAIACLLENASLLRSFGI